MQELVSILLIGVSLSMDTFSLSLSLGSIIKNNSILKLFPFLVGIFHFFMPLLGNFIGTSIINYFNIASNIILGIILIILGVNLSINYFKDNELNIKISLLSLITLAFSVSIDSFTVGLAISDITKNNFLASFIFSICSFSFTLMGLTIGKYSNKVMGKYATIIGIFFLLLLGIIHLF